MPPGYGLGRLQVGESRHDEVCAVFRLIDQRPDEAREVLCCPFGLLPHPHAEIGGHQIVPA